MVLPQDAAQASQASNVIAEREYQANLAQYEQDKKKYETDKKKAEEKAKAEAEQKKQVKSDYDTRRVEYIHQLQRTPGITSRKLNLAVHEWEARERGISKADFQKIVARDLANEKRARSQSAGLRASGNAQIKSANQAELKRLGATETSGPVKVSATLKTDRVPTAEGTAAKAQDFPESFQYKPQVKKTNSPAENFAAIADPNASGFREPTKPQAPIPPQKKGESIRNQIAPILIPLKQRSDVGYAPDGKPVQGAPQRQGDFQVGDKNFTYASQALEYAEMQSRKNFITPASLTEYSKLFTTTYTVGNKEFATKKEAQRYIETQNDNPKLTPTSQAQFEISKFLDKASQWKSGNPIIDTSYSTVIGYPLGTTRSIVEGVNVLDNIGKTVLPKYTGIGSVETDPIPIQRTGDEVLLPIAIEESGVRGKILGEIRNDSIEYAKKYSVGDLMGGAISTYVPIGMGVKTVGVAAGKLIVRKTAPKLVGVATRGSTPLVIKKPVIIQPRKPVIGKDVLYKNISTRQKGISGNPKLSPTYTPDPSPNIGTGVIPKENIIGRIEFSKGFIPNKPSRPFTPLDTKKPVAPDPYYKPARRANEIDYTDNFQIGFERTNINLGYGVVKTPPKTFKTRLVKEDPNYQPSIMSQFSESKIRLGTGQAKIPKIKGETTYADLQFRRFQTSATIVGKIKLSPGFLPSKVKPSVKTFKKLDFQNPWRVKTRKFDEPKIDKGDKLVGKDGSVQIVKTKDEFIKLKKPKKTPLDIINKPESTAETPKAISARPIVILAKPAGRLPIKKRKPMESRTAQQQIYQEPEYQRTNLPQRTGGIISAKTSARIISKTAPKISPRSNVRIIPRISQKQPQKIAQSNKLKNTSPNPVRPKLRSRPIFKTRQPQRTRLTEVPKDPLRKRAVAAVLPPIDDRKEKKRKKKSDQFDFLGNTRLGNIEGLFRRSEIMTGDKKIVKQIRKDKKAGFKERGVRIFKR